MARWQLTMALAGVAVGCVSCSGTPFGDALSSNFADQPPGPAPVEALVATEAANEVGLPPTPDSTTPPSTAPSTAGGSPDSGDSATPEPPPSRTVRAAEAPGPAEPEEVAKAPYRIVILLPNADSTAPSAVLSRALREAGVDFSVETIDRLDRSSTIEKRAPATSDESSPPEDRP